MGILRLFALLMGLAAGQVLAGTVEMVELAACTDATGQVVPGRQDPTLPVLVRAGLEDGQRVLRYNPEALPNLSAEARQFFFAQACARLALGEAPGAEPTAARARRADCLGLAMLLDGAILKDAAAVRALQAELAFTEAEWAQLPGPRRSFDLAACPRPAGIALPPATPPSPGQARWDACVRQCGDRLFRCQGGCRGDGCGGCLEAYRRCEAGCRAD